MNTLLQAERTCTSCSFVKAPKTQPHLNWPIKRSMDHKKKAYFKYKKCKCTYKVQSIRNAKWWRNSFFIIMKGIAQDLDFAPFKACRSIRNVTRIGSSNCVKIMLEDETSLFSALGSGLKIDYELSQVY